MSQFEGIVPAIPTPMNAEGQIAEEALRKLVEFNIKAGVHGFWVSGGTGESVLLEDEENRRVAEIVVDQGQVRVNNIIHVGAATTARAAGLAEHAARVGAEAICCVPPFFYSRSDEEIVEHYRVVAAAADLGLPYLPGIATASEAMAAQRAGLRCLKLFPAEAMGGAKTLAALAGPYPRLIFCPTGGIGRNNAGDYLALGNVHCVGGSWVAPPNLVRREDWDAICELASLAARLER